MTLAGQTKTFFLSKASKRARYQANSLAERINLPAWFGQCRGKFLFFRSSVKKTFAACENLIAILLKILMKYLFEEHFFCQYTWVFLTNHNIRDHLFYCTLGSPFCLMLIGF